MDFLLDSGAFSLKDAKKNEKEDYFEKYVQFLRNNPWISKYFVLDDMLDHQRTVDNFSAMIHRYGLKPIPIFDIKSPFLYLKYYLDRMPGDMIGIGGMVGISERHLMTILPTVFKKIAEYEEATETRVKVHGLGMGRSKILGEFPWYSVDNSTWVLSAVNGLQLAPDLRQEKAEFEDLDGKEVYKKNLNAMKSFCASKRVKFYACDLKKIFQYSLLSAEELSSGRFLESFYYISKRPKVVETLKTFFPE